ncbi:MAG: ABC transporter ATP-binding protein [Clostridiaceae bacterium]
MIEIKNLNKSFFQRQLFKDLNISIGDGEMVAIVGVSGVGKSTLLNIIGSLEKFDSGSVTVGNTDLSKMSRKNQLLFLRNEVSFLFQNYALMDNKTVIENIILNNKAKNTDELAKSALEQLKLNGFENRIVSSLSGGEQQRVALARVMVKPSKVVLADEPTGNLDKDNSKIVWDTLKHLNKSGKTVVVVTHDLSSLSNFDKVVYL